MLGKVVLVLTAAAGLTLGTYGVVRSHCEIPCGIYGDKMRVAMLYEHIATIEKSMKQIDAIMAQDPPNANQVVRWVNSKEKHAEEIQHIVTQYFMTQRVKPKAPATAAHGKYIEQLTSLHEMLIAAMKCKQSTDVANCANLRSLVARFSKAYLSAEDLKHVQEHHGGGH
jgi:nickel superoxide dismutase